MRRWNGWGEQLRDVPVPSGLVTLLAAEVGPGVTSRDAGLDELLRTVPAARLPGRQGLSCDPLTGCSTSAGRASRTWRFPLAVGVNVRSPRDGRHVSVFPWQGATVVGTTDVDCPEGADAATRITSDELDYLLECLQGPFRALELTAHDVVSTWSALRPIVVTTDGPASAGPLPTASHNASRGHLVVDEDGLVTAAGGKLTTFELLAAQIMRTASRRLSAAGAGARRPLAHSVTGAGVGAAAARDATWERLAGTDAGSEGWAVTGTVTGTPVAWSALRWSARFEAVNCLEDLMLRRTRLGCCCLGAVKRC